MPSWWFSTPIKKRSAQSSNGNSDFFPVLGATLPTIRMKPPTHDAFILFGIWRWSPSPYQRPKVVQWLPPSREKASPTLSQLTFTPAFPACPVHVNVILLTTTIRCCQGSLTKTHQVFEQKSQNWHRCSSHNINAWNKCASQGWLAFLFF